MEDLERICRFCFEKCDMNYKAIEKNTHEMLNILLIEMNLAISKKPVTCTKCVEILQNCFVFKTTCVGIQDHTVVANDNEDCAICHLCTKLLTNSSITILDSEEDIKPRKTMLEKYFPELMDSSASKKLIFCENCESSLLNFFGFITSCSIVEEKIKKYCEAEGVDNSDLIELNNVLQFISENDWKEKNKKLEVIKTEDRISVKSETEVQHKFNDLLETEDDKFSPEYISILNKNGNKTNIIKTEEFFDMENEADHANENFEEVKDEKILPCDDEEFKIKTDQRDFDRFDNGIVSPQPDSTRKDPKGNLDEDLPDSYSKRTSTDENNSTTHKRDSSHLLTCKDPLEIPVYTCNSCSYQTKHKSALKKHLTAHQDPSDVPTHECNSCPYRTKYVSRMKTHSLKHKDPSQVTMYGCSSCSFQTKYKRNLKIHSLRHEDASGVTTYVCGSCPYRTRFKNGLKTHSLEHKDPSELTLHRCDSCSFQTVYLCSLKKHRLVHKDPTEVKMYSCGSCPFQSRDKHGVKTHSLVHKDPSEIKMYNCGVCSFRSRDRHNLKSHSLVHMDASEVPMYGCSSCSFRSKRKSGLKNHLLVHRDASNTTMYRCGSCSYETKFKHLLKTHSLRHRDASEVPMYGCGSCGYQAKRKSHLKRHEQRHCSEGRMYGCGECSYRTKRRRFLDVHLLKHKGAAGASVQT